MAKDKIAEILEDFDYRLKHIEDAILDHRDILVKLVKQNNTIVQYLKQLDVEMVDEYGEPITKEEEQRIKKSEELKEVLDEFMAERKDLQEFEKELKKHKDKLTPGQVGES